MLIIRQKHYALGLKVLSFTTAPNEKRDTRSEFSLHQPNVQRRHEPLKIS